MKVLTVVGARPNFMKAAPIITAIRRHNERVAGTGVSARVSVPRIDQILVHTGQHYDALMSDAFFADLNLPPPDFHLGVGAGSPISQIAEILNRFESVLVNKKPDVVIVVGDVNSTVAAALAAAKISLDAVGGRPLLAHVEAGLRSFDRSMPEEINRVLTDHVSDLLFVSEPSGLQNLLHEGIPRESMHFVGNTMIDSVMAFKEKADDTGILERLGLCAAMGGANANCRTGRYALLTLHRPSNVDNQEIFQNILAGLEELAAECPVIFPVHPRTKERIRSFGICPGSGMATPGKTSCGIMMIEPLGYLEFLCLMKHAAIVVTDSGGIQEETTCLGVPCVTARENTERPVTIEAGTNIIAGTTKHKIQAAIRQQLERKPRGTTPSKWDGQAAGRIVDVLVDAHCKRRTDELKTLMSTGAVGPP
jgi:UDP-N-acetylglucosamine 2-epimerase (non-hydrolysing)